MPLDVTPPRVAITICTFRRPSHLGTLLRSLDALGFEKCCPPHVEIHVIDNDAEESARPIVEDAAHRHRFPLRYIVEPRRGLSSVRNAALDAAADFDFLAFVDDDEVVEPQWLDELLVVADRQSAQFVIGPVRPVYPEDCPGYLRDSGLYSRLEHSDGARIDTGNTGNALLRMAFLKDKSIRFREDFELSGGEDACFFAELAAAGGTGAYAANAIAHEPVSVDRLSIAWLMKRRYRFGTTEVRQALIASRPTKSLPLAFAAHGVLRIVAALVLTTAVLPFSRAKALRYACAGARGAGYLAGALGFNAREY